MKPTKHRGISEATQNTRDRTMVWVHKGLLYFKPHRVTELVDRKPKTQKPSSLGSRSPRRKRTDPRHLPLQRAEDMGVPKRSTITPFKWYMKKKAKKASPP